MQNAGAYYNVTADPGTAGTQGICPTGWHVPTGNTSGQFAALDTANGGTGANRSSCDDTDASCKFWRPSGNFKGLYSGYCGNSGSLGSQGSYGLWWSSSPGLSSGAYRLDMSSSGVYPGVSTHYRLYGFTVRCQRD
jgi:uncharacterized protein (TIGR02145 family)